MILHNLKEQQQNHATEILTHRRCSQSLTPHQLGRAKAIQKIAELAVRGQADTREDQTESRITKGIKPISQPRFPGSPLLQELWEPLLGHLH